MKGERCNGSFFNNRCDLGSTMQQGIQYSDRFISFTSITVRLVFLAIALCIGGSILAQGYTYVNTMNGDLDSTATNSKFGWSMATSGNNVVVGSPFHSDRLGRVSVFQNASFGDTQVPVHLIDVNNQGGANPAIETFGATVALSGDWLAVGNCSPFGSSQYCSTGVNWVTLFHFDGAGWQAYPRFLRPNGATSGNFGKAIALADDLMVVGGARTSDDTDGQDVVYFYRRNGTVWPTLPSDSLFGNGSLTGEWEAFGHALSMRDGQLVIGAPGDDELGMDCGAVYLYGRDHGGTNNWGLVRKLLPANGVAGDHFGTAVAIKDDRCVVGAPGRSINGVSAGAGYLYEADAGFPGNWGEVAYLEPIGTPGIGMALGTAVALGPDRIALGAPHHKLSAFENDGSVHVYRREGMAWPPVQRIDPYADGVINVVGRAGNAVGFVGEHLLIGAPWAKLLSQTPPAEITGVVLVYSEGPVSVPSHASSDVRLWPNPCAESVQLQSGTSTITRVRIMDAMGRVLQPWESVSRGTHQLDLTGVASGSYFVQCEMANGEHFTLPLMRR